ncbi:MAG TPA: regulatory iron-sulfur-containing complex subunit RicT [Candidatus Eisenbacteria bacterium]
MSGCATGGCSVGNSYNPGGHYIGIRLNENEDGRVVFCETQGQTLVRGQRVVVEGDQGLEHAQVTTLRPLIVKQCQLRDARRLVRLANDTDLASYAAKVAREGRFLADTQGLVTEKRLPLKLVRAEESFDGRKYTIHYTSETRIDYRKLVADLALKYPLRIEMRQIGPRDETRMRGGLGPCGLTLCCSTFLKGFHPVTIKMAKNQNLSLNPSKISGMCGRLMCCLAYEDEGRRPPIETASKKPQNISPEAAV